MKGSKEIRKAMEHRREGGRQERGGRNKQKNRVMFKTDATSSACFFQSVRHKIVR